MERVLVVGARPDSLGEAIAGWLRGDDEYVVTTAGLAHEEVYVNLLIPESVYGLFKTAGSFDHVICTAGRNLDGNSTPELSEQLKLNCWGIAVLFEEWMAALEASGEVIGSGHHLWKEKTFHHFLAVSSNSAHLPRSRSAGYCASKAALSMYLRCQARAMQGSNVVVSVAEPGWIQGTPMSREVAARFNMADEGLCSADLALVLAKVLKHGPEWNGVVLRMDGGER